MQMLCIIFFVLTGYKKSTNVLKALSGVCQGSINTKEKGATSAVQAGNRSQIKKVDRETK